MQNEHALTIKLTIWINNREMRNEILLAKWSICSRRSRNKRSWCAIWPLISRSRYESCWLKSAAAAAATLFAPASFSRKDWNTHTSGKHTKWMKRAKWKNDRKLFCEEIMPTCLSSIWKTDVPQRVGNVQ